MKVALVYDYLNQFGGGERVLEIFLGLFPEADLYTLFYDSQKTLYRIPKSRVTKTSFLNKKTVINNHRIFIPLMPIAANSINLGYNYDLIISITAGYAKGIKYSRGRHICYCFTPLRYAWEEEHYIKNKLGSSYNILKPIIKPTANYLKNWDYKMAQKPDQIISISNYIKNQIQKYYNRDSNIIYPPVDLNTFYPEKVKPRNYFLATGRLMHYKNFDIIIDAFNELKIPLKIVGRGPELKKLAKQNTSINTSFLTTPQTDKDMRLLYSNAKALIFPQVEDFGLVAIESIACGTPVIAYNQGGALDIIKENINGIFIKEQTKEAIIEAINKIENRDFNPDYIRQTAKQFSLENFKTNIKKVIFDK